MDKIYALRSENLSGLGGMMGTESTFTNWRRYFSSLEKAKRCAEEDVDFKLYKGTGAGRETTINWAEVPGDEFCLRSRDFGWVMYHITEITVED